MGQGGGISRVLRAGGKYVNKVGLIMSAYSTTDLPPTPRRRAAQITIRTDNMDLAGDLVGDLVGYLGLTDLGSTADFPLAMTAFKEVLNAVRWARMRGLGRAGF